MSTIEALDPEAEAIGKRMAAMIADQETLDQVLAEAGSDAKRTVIMAYVGPHLKFERTEEKPITDCPRCGFHRGTLLPHQCLAED
jgi:hypothetical protein